MNLERLLSESSAAARRREQAAFSCDSAAKLVLMGAGHLGRKVLSALRKRGIEALAFVDHSSTLQGTQVDGLQVLSPADGAKRFGTEATFIVTIFRGTGDGGMAARERLLHSLGCRQVTNFLTVAWRYPAELLPHYGAALPSTILSAAAEIAEVGAAWQDELSREVFLAQLLWRLRADFGGLSAPSAFQYFPPDLLSPRTDEAFVDGGAYDGDTLRVLGPRFDKAWAIEPDPTNVARLRAQGDPRVTVLECALGSLPGEANFAANQGVGSALSAMGSSKVSVETLDRLFEREKPTFIKLDIEGAEQAALEGARSMLSRHQPTLAVCTYHRPDDLWKIPGFLRKVLPQHRLSLRAHENDGFELVAYAIPPGR